MKSQKIKIKMNYRFQIMDVISDLMQWGNSGTKFLPESKLRSKVERRNTLFKKPISTQGIQQICAYWALLQQDI